MDCMESWNKIVKLVKKHWHDDEKIIQVTWEDTVFGTILSDSDCKFVPQEVVEGTAKRMDIVIKQNENAVAVVEMKRHTHSRNEKAGRVTPQEQLFSYLNQLKSVGIGILVCDKLHIYAYDFTKSAEKNERDRLDIPFEKDNEVGEKFVELFNKMRFDSKKVREFISQKIRSAQNIKNLREEIENSKELTIKLLENEFAPKYGKAEFDEVMKEFDIQIVKKVPAAVFAPKAHESIVHAPLTEKGEKDDLDKLKKYIRTVGMSTFVKYYEQFANPHSDTGDVKQVMRNNNEPWSDNSFNTKASAGKWIIKNNYGKEALQIIANASITDSKTIQKARALLEKHF